MSKFRDLHKSASGSHSKEEQGECPTQLNELPCLKDALMGYEDKPGHMTKGMSMTIWFADRRLKFSLNDKANKLVGFAVVKGDKPLGEAIEEALEGEEIEWKDKD